MHARNDLSFNNIIKKLSNKVGNIWFFSTFFKKSCFSKLDFLCKFDSFVGSTDTVTVISYTFHFARTNCIIFSYENGVHYKHTVLEQESCWDRKRPLFFPVQSTSAENRSIATVDNTPWLRARAYVGYLYTRYIFYFGERVTHTTLRTNHTRRAYTYLLLLLLLLRVYIYIYTP